MRTHRPSPAPCPAAAASVTRALCRPGLCRLLGLTATRAAHAAAADFLQLSSRDPLRELAHVYLAAFAMASAPDVSRAPNVLRPRPLPRPY